MKDTVEPSNDAALAVKVIINVYIFKSVTMCLSMYARQHRMPLENSLHPHQMGYYLRLMLYNCTYIVTIDVFAKRTICFSFLFIKYSFITKCCMLSRFGNAA